MLTRTYLVLVLISLASANSHEYHPSAKKSRATNLQGSITLQATRQCTKHTGNRDANPGYPASRQAIPMTWTP
ncbi:hypothetical protein GGI42DRAFT_331784 [Trichoderma sp. SZMC 28013]